MSNKIIYIYTSENLTAYVQGKTFCIHKSNPKFQDLLDALKRNAEPSEVFDICCEAEQLVKFMQTNGAAGVVTLKGDTVYVNGEPASGPIVEKIRQFKVEGLDVQPLLNYFNRLQANPSRRAVNELYTFLEKENLPITPEGNILAYKAVQNNWYDKHTGKHLNSIGSVLEMSRNAVDDNTDVGCGAGYHAGSIEYVRGFASGYGSATGDRIVIVEIDPADVVSIPKDNNFTKMRVCKYKVVAEYQGELPKAFVPDSAAPYPDADTDANNDVDVDDSDDDDDVY